MYAVKEGDYRQMRAGLRHGSYRMSANGFHRFCGRDSPVRCSGWVAVAGSAFHCKSFLPTGFSFGLRIQNGPNLWVGFILRGPCKTPLSEHLRPL